MLWMPLLKVLPNSLYILLTLMFLFWLPNGIQITGTSSSRTVINLKSIADALGPTKTAALPAFHALTGADVTGSFSGEGKPLVGMSLITPTLLSCKILLTSVVGNSQMTAKELEWNSWFVGCTNQRQTSIENCQSPQMVPL